MRGRRGAMQSVARRDGVGFGGGDLDILDHFLCFLDVLCVSFRVSDTVAPKV